VTSNPPVPSYSQNAEDVRLWRVLRNVSDGFYVDVGAWHPTLDSVTQLFYERGWSGINIEPGPHYAELAEARPRDVNLEVAIGTTEGTTKLHVIRSHSGLSTVDSELLGRNTERLDIEQVETIEVPQRKLETILTEYALDRRIDFLKVDVEGAERAVLESSDWNRFRPRIVVVEAIKPLSHEMNHQEWEMILLDNGYLYATFDGINRFYVSTENASFAATLAYPMSVLDGYVPADLRRTLEEQRRSLERVEKLQKQVEAFRNDATASKARARLAEERLRSMRASRTWRLAMALRRLVLPFRRILHPSARVAKRMLLVKQTKRSAASPRGGSGSTRT